jgi:hypothetical protein
MSRRGFLYALGGGCRASKTVEPRDQELISTFHAHRQVFEQLQKMATEDARRGWYLLGSDQNKPDQPRRDEYKNLISQIRPGLQVAMTGPAGTVRFIFASEGVAIGRVGLKGLNTCRATTAGRVFSYLIWTRPAVCPPVFTCDRSSRSGSSSINATSSQSHSATPFLGAWRAIARRWLSWDLTGAALEGSHKYDFSTGYQARTLCHQDHCNDLSPQN